MPISLDIESLLPQLAHQVLLDVRTPTEFAGGHIPGAQNLPLFSDEERAVVGTIYKQESKDRAFRKGLEFVGPKMAGFVEAAEKLANGNRQLAIHCWRGGQRSRSMAWLFDLAGFEVATLEGGYKAYRQHLHDQFENRRLNLVVLGGKTGSGKTRILEKLQSLGEQVIDLEGLANHKGSAFGWLLEKPQPRVEQFENDLFEIFRKIDPARRVWVENESRTIGKIYLPEPFWRQMKSAPLLHIELPFEARLDNSMADYAAAPMEGLVLSFQKIETKLGGQHLKEALQHLERGELRQAAAIALRYYDKLYMHSFETNPASEKTILEFENFDAENIAGVLATQPSGFHAR